jgi:hypothetical protein
MSVMGRRKDMLLERLRDTFSTLAALPKVFSMPSHLLRKMQLSQKVAIMMLNILWEFLNIMQ